VKEDFVAKYEKLTKVYLAKYEHKHGTEEVAFTTQQGAADQLKAWAEEYVGDWDAFGSVEGEPTYSEMDADKLVDRWTNITGGNEFLYIDELPLNEGRGPGVPAAFNK